MNYVGVSFLGLPTGGSNIKIISSQVDFGTSGSETLVNTVVTGLSYITNNSKVILTLYGENSGNRSVEDSVLESIILSSSDIVAGVGFTINAYAPFGANGIYKINCLIGE